jgi:hypothetical protein
MTNNLSKAKQWIQSSVRAAALTVVPLSAVAVSEATVILPNDATFVSSGGSTGGSLDSMMTSVSYSELNEIQGVYIANTAPLTETGAFWNPSDVYMVIDGYFANTVATTSVPLGTTIPISFQFDISVVNGADPIGDLEYTVVALGYGPTLLSYNYHFTTAGIHTVSAEIQTTADFDPGAILMSSFHFSATSTAESMTLNSFSFSVNENGSPLSAVPEPGSLLLVFGSLGVAVFRRRRNRA